MTDETNPREELLDIGPLNEERMSPAVAVASVAMNFALKYHDINTVQEGALYQQYKLEGRNMRDLHLDMVFETAKRIELHLITSANRLSEEVYRTLIEAIAAEPGPPEEAGEGEA